ncbi:ATP synthase F1 subunit delta [Stomatobaculum longum]|uniref:ATP synthase F1 subunit delta n=1 Tax=Stomatobaculum longum TaxID=796942 RepID=UPI00280557B3|nr:ATP synthase F1 subunit delta [Stomatobaculum longum]
MMRAAELYGGSLYDLAAEEKQEQDILTEMQGIGTLLRENPKYAALLSEPSIPKEKRLELLDQAFRGEIRPYLLNFLKLITERELLSQYGGMCRAYERRFNAAHNIVAATVRTAVPLDQEERDRLKEALGKRSGKQVVLREMLDASLLGGIVVEIDGKTLDGSVAGRLLEIRKKVEEIVL